MLTVHRATDKDQNFICSHILAASRKGHFAIDPDNREMVTSMKQEIFSIINKKQLLNGLGTFTFVFYNKSTRVGFTIITESPVNDGGFEIHAMLVLPEYQHQGFGSFMLDTVLGRMLSDKVYARCSPQSEAMINMLHKRGFIEISTNELNYKIMRREPLDNYMPA